ncbi:MAG: coproporphyrinogen III oxidase, partial [Bacteroidota bacterium]|nr:coproporphyrinogen III oxidase [Bacteroidota bacterium]MDX5431033.1 coproporphyrinogen III oxidase [Bacteroidota bacterium]MDX5469787.1 coproporphyrinogen III oxidase [Bacteroidota bacterium]
SAGFHSFNGDLIFGYPLLSDDKLEANLKYMIDYGVNHLSTYSMTVEKGTALEFGIRKGKEKPMYEGQAERQYRFIMLWLREKGWDHYEVSNFCKPGKPSIHNASYWSGAPYLGIGPSAHGFDGKERYWNLANNAGYLKQMQQGQLPEEREVLSATDRYNEFLMTRLRTAKGIQREECEALFGSGSFLKVQHQINSPELRPYFHSNATSLSLNEEGFLLADYLISELFEV